MDIRVDGTAGRSILEYAIPDDVCVCGVVWIPICIFAFSASLFEKVLWVPPPRLSDLSSGRSKEPEEPSFFLLMYYCTMEKRGGVRLGYAFPAGVRKRKKRQKKCRQRRPVGSIGISPFFSLAAMIWPFDFFTPFEFFFTLILCQDRRDWSSGKVQVCNCDFNRPHPPPVGFEGAASGAVETPKEQECTKTRDVSHWKETSFVGNKRSIWKYFFCDLRGLSRILVRCNILRVHPREKNEPPSGQPCIIFSSAPVHHQRRS